MSRLGLQCFTGQNAIQNSGFVPKQQRIMFLGSPELGAPCFDQALLPQQRGLLGTEACLAWLTGILTLCLQNNCVRGGHFLTLTLPGHKHSLILHVG